MEELVTKHRELLDELEALLLKGGATVVAVTEKVIELDINHREMIKLCRDKLDA